MTSQRNHTTQEGGEMKDKAATLNYILTEKHVPRVKRIGPVRPFRHTPGPWTLEHSSAKREPGELCGTAAFNRVVGDGMELATGIQREANARLIAAGPELLAVCKSVLAFTVSDNYDWKGAINEIRVEARAAILKARAGQ